MNVYWWRFVVWGFFSSGAKIYCGARVWDVIDDTISEDAAPVSSKDIWVDMVPFCIFATIGESDRDMVLFLDMVTFSFSSVAFLLATVHVDALSACALSRFAIPSFLFVALSDNMSFCSGVVLILTRNLCLILLFYTL